MHWRTTLAYLLAAGCLAAVVWAFSFGTLPPADFTFSNLGEIKTVDPALVSGQSEGRVVWALFEGLTRWNPKTLEPEPGVAERWEISPDRLTYTFYLRADARWSDGSPVTADDFVWSYRRFLHPETAAEYAAEMWYVLGAKRYTSGQVTPGDPVEVELVEKPPGARPFASGIILRGRLLAVERGSATGGSGAAENPPEEPDDATAQAAESKPSPSQSEASASSSAAAGGDGPPIYVVEIDGRKRRFQKGARSPGTEDYRWLLYDFHQVGICALDRRTLQIRLRHPVPYFLNLMGFYPMSPVNRKCVETHGYPAWTKPENIINNGAFLLKFRRIRDRIRLVKNPYYWDRDNVRLNVVDVLAVESYPTNLNLYMTGQVDWIPAVPVEVVPELLARPQRDFHADPFLATYYYLINTRRPPLDDVRVRRALAMAIDKREIVEKITRAGQIPIRSIVPPGISRWIDYTPQQCEPYAPERARRLLAEAGFSGGRGFPRIDILYNTSEAHQAIAELIQAQWKRNLGIDVTLRNQEWSVYLSSRRQGDYYVARAGWIADYVDPITYLDMFTGDSPLNNTGWNNEQYNRLVESARLEPDQHKRLRLLEKAERLLMEQLPLIPIYAYVSQNLVRPYVKGFYSNIQDVHPLRAIWIDKAQKEQILRQEGLR